jgi:hypothetical protein
LTVDRISTLVIVASRDKGLRSPEGVVIRMAPIAFGPARIFSGRRMTSGKRNCPFCTSPRRLQSWKSSHR